MAETVTIKIGSHTPPKSSHVSQGLVPWCRAVEKDSGGTVKFQEFWGGQLSRSPVKQYEIMMNGIQDATPVLPSYTQELFPDFSLFSLPYLFRNATEGSIAMWRMYEKGLLGGLDDVYVAAIYNNGNSLLHLSKHIETADEIKGLKIRVQESPLFVNMVKGLGANPTPIAWPEVYTALQTGVVDGQENPVSVILVAKFAEVQKYLVLDRHVYGLDWFVVNDKWYQSLPKDLQKVIMDAAIVSRTVGRGIQQLNSAGIGLAKLKEQGMEIYAPTPEEMALFKEATQKPVIDWLKTKVDPKLIEEALQTVAEASK